ncbi:hypothetical protein B0H11DRAFT_2058817, partial [Mycena galericulata]
MANFIATLPAELWIALFSQLYLADLLSVSATCKSFQTLAFESLQKHQTLHRRYYRLGYSSNDSWYSLLLNLLRDPTAAYYVEDLEVEYTIGKEDMARRGGTEALLTVLPEDETVIVKAVEEERWIPEVEKGHFLDVLLAGDEDAMVTLMILRMPNLKRLSLPTHCWGGLNFNYLMPIVARIAQIAANAEDESLPLSKLERFDGHIFNCFLGVDFEGIAPLMALPSLRTMSTPLNAEEGFDWPPSLPRSHVRQIDIRGGTVPLKAIKRLARGIRGPCVIRQKWGRRRHDHTPKHDWNGLEIPFKDACEEEWMVDEYDGDSGGSDS